MYASGQLMIEAMEPDIRPATPRLEDTIRELLQEPPQSLVAALEGRGHTPEQLEEYTRSPLTGQEQQSLRQLMLQAASSAAPEDSRLAAHLRELLDPRERAWQRVTQAFEANEVISAMVLESVKGGLVVDLGVRGFIPASHAGLGQNVNLQGMVGRTVPLRVIELNRRRQVVVLSHRRVLEEQRAARRKETLRSLQAGEVREGIVRRLSDIGAFVDVGGVDGLLHVSEISWSTVRHPSDALKVGQKIQVLIQKVEPEQGRISLSIRRLAPDPWVETRKGLQLGRTVRGRVSDLVSGGALVEIDGGQEAFIPMRELASRRISRADEVVQIGQELEAIVLELRDRDRKIVLSLREAQEQRERKEYQTFSRRQRDDGRTTLGDLFGHLFVDQLREAAEANRSAADKGVNGSAPLASGDRDGPAPPHRAEGPLSTVDAQPAIEPPGGDAAFTVHPEAPSVATDEPTAGGRPKRTRKPRVKAEDAVAEPAPETQPVAGDRVRRRSAGRTTAAGRASVGARAEEATIEMGPADGLAESSSTLDPGDTLGDGSPSDTPAAAAPGSRGGVA
jgi:small subunit ribosomal protein S1